jgi:excisionase family DNA binding protein
MGHIRGERNPPEKRAIWCVHSGWTFAQPISTSFTRATDAQSARQGTSGPLSRILDLEQHDQPYVSVAELARYWGISDDMIRRDIEKGALRAMVVGSSQVIRIPIAEARLYGRPRTSPE